MGELAAGILLMVLISLWLFRYKISFYFLGQWMVSGKGKRKRCKDEEFAFKKVFRLVSDEKILSKENLRQKIIREHQRHLRIRSLIKFNEERIGEHGFKFFDKLEEIKKNEIF